MRALLGVARTVGPVGLGLAAVGGGSVLATAMASRALGETEFAVFATWWTAANLLGLAFAVVEMYVPRLLVGTPVPEQTGLLRTTTRTVLAVVAGLALLLLLTAPLSVPRLLDGRVPLLALAAAYMALLALQSQQRAVATGRERFRLFAWQMGADGLGRVLLCGVLLLAGAERAEAFAVALCAAAAAGVVVGHLVEPHWGVLRGPGEAVPLRPVLLLLAASLGPLVVNNAGVPWLSAEGSAGALAVGAAAGALVLSRIPTLLVGAAYGPVLAPLSRAVDEGRASDFRRVRGLALLAAGVLGGVFVLAFAAAGGRLLALYLGPGYGLPVGELALFAAGSALMLVAVVQQAALAALRAWSASAGAWLAGLAGFVGTLVLPLEPVLRLAAAVTVAPSVALVVMLAAGVRAQRRVWS